MRLVITGAEGHSGRSLQEALRENELLLDLPEYDVVDRGVIPFIADSGADLVIHAAAMTDVDGRVFARAARVPRRAVLCNFSAARQLGIVLRAREEVLEAYFEERGHAWYR